MVNKILFFSSQNTKAMDDKMRSKTFSILSRILLQSMLIGISVLLFGC